MSQNSAPLPNNSDSPTGRSQRGQRDVGDLFGPFFRVAFKNVSQADATANTNENDPTSNSNNTTADKLVSDDVFQTENLALTPPTEDTKTFEIDSRLLPKTAAGLKIESKANAALKFTLTLTPPYEDGIRILNSRLINFGTLVKVQWGYTGWGGESTILSDIFVFRNNFPQAEFGDDISIIVSGHDLTASVGSRNAAKKCWLFSENPTDCDIVSKIVARTNVKLDVSGVPETSNFLTGANRPQPETGGKTPAAGIEQTVNDWSFLRRLLNDHGLSFTAQGADFKVFSLFDASTASTYSYRFLWRQKLKTKRDIPVMNVRGNLMPWTFLPAEGRGLVQYLFDGNDPNKSKLNLQSPASKKEPSLGAGGAAGEANAIPSDVTSMGGDGDGVGVFDEETGLFVVRPKPDPNEDAPPLISVPEEVHNAEQKIDNEVNRIQAFSHPMVGITAPGAVDLWPGVTVMLEGTSDLFDGPYYVRDATHTINSSGYDMELMLMRHTVKGQLGETPTAPLVTPTSEGDADEATTAVPEDGSPLPGETGVTDILNEGL